MVQDFSPRGMLKTIREVLFSSYEDRKININSTERLKKPFALPENNLNPIFVELDNSETPRSIGSDGMVYCSGSGNEGNDIKLYRFSGEYSSATVEEGYDFSNEHPNGTIHYVTKTKKGYVVMINDFGTGTQAKIYFSESFSSGFSLVQELSPDTSAQFWNCDFFHGDKISNTSIGLVGEYSSNDGDVPHKLWLTKDAGESWESILTTEIIDSTTQVHFHGVAYDPYDSRIYAAQGDGDNDRLWYSEDLGESWEYIDEFIDKDKLGRFETGKGLHQPTMIIPTAQKIIITPDTYLPPLIMSLRKDNGFTEVDSYKWELHHEHSVYNGKATGQFFAKTPYATKNGEIYFMFPDNSNELYYIVGSGDNGMSWHTLYSITMPSNSNLNYGITGIDKDGYMSAYCVIGSTAYILQSEKAKWIKR